MWFIYWQLMYFLKGLTPHTLLLILNLDYVSNKTTMKKKTDAPLTVYKVFCVGAMNIFHSICTSLVSPAHLLPSSCPADRQHKLWHASPLSKNNQNVLLGLDASINSQLFRWGGMWLKRCKTDETFCRKLFYFPDHYFQKLSETC